MRAPRRAAALALAVLAVTAAAPPLATAAGTDEPGAPTDLTAERRADHVALDWDAPEDGDPLVYVVYRRADPGDAWREIDRSLNTTYRDDAPPRPDPGGDGPRLQYAVSAESPPGEGPRSAPATLPPADAYVEIEEPRGGDVHGCLLAGFCPPGLAQAHLDTVLCAPEHRQVDMGEACEVAWAAGRVHVQAYAACGAGLAEIAFRVGQGAWHGDPEPVREGIYRWTWDAGGNPVGEHTLRVQATCQDGARATATQRLFVLGPTAPRPFAGASAALDGVRATTSADLDGFPDRDIATDDPSEGCLDASVSAGVYFLDEGADGSACSSTPWAWSLRLIAHHLHAEARGDRTHLGDLADGQRPVQVTGDEATSFCAGAEAQATPEGGRPQHASGSSCHLAPVATGTYRVSLLKDGWWLHALVSGYDPLDRSTPFPPSPTVWTEEDPEADDCYGIRVQAPHVGTVGAVVGPIPEPWDLPSASNADELPDHVDPGGEGCGEV